MAYLFLRQFLAGNGLVLQVVRAIDTAVYAVVGKVERCEHHDAVAVELPLDFLGKVEDTFRQVGQVAFQQYGGFAVGQSLAKRRLFDELLYQGTVVLMGAGVFQCIDNLLVVDELFRYF